jgi:hypothetical protein
MIHRPRRIGAVVLSIACMCSVAACGSSSNSGSASTGTAPSGHAAPVGLKLTSSEQSCLKKKGVTLPTGGFRGGPPGATGAHGGAPNFKGHGKFPKGRFPKGKFPTGAHRSGGFAQSSKFRTAFKACGVTFPSGGSQGAPSSTTG